MHIASGFVEPKLSLILVPFGVAPITTTSAPSSHKTLGAVLYAAPLAQSSTTFKPSRRKFFGKVFFANSI